MEILHPYRQKIDSLDDQIVDLLVKREAIIREVAALKAANNIPAVLQDRVDEVRNRCVARAAEQGASAALIEQLYTQIIQFSCDLEDTIKDQISS